MTKVKYIKTKDKQIIVFPEYITHDQFSDWNPISAGFISFGAVMSKNLDYMMTTCTCYGKSVSLKLESQAEDTELAKRQILGEGYF